MEIGIIRHRQGRFLVSIFRMAEEYSSARKKPARYPSVMGLVNKFRPRIYRGKQRGKAMGKDGLLHCGIFLKVLRRNTIDFDVFKTRGIVGLFAVAASVLP